MARIQWHEAARFNPKTFHIVKNTTSSLVILIIHCRGNSVGQTTAKKSSFQHCLKSMPCSLPPQLFGLHPCIDSQSAFPTMLRQWKPLGVE